MKSSIEILLSDLEIYDKVSVKELWSGEKTEAEAAFHVSLNSHGAKAFYLQKA